MEYSEQIDHFGEPCSICGTQPALLVDAEEKGTYWMCANCMFETIKDKMRLEKEIQRLSAALYDTENLGLCRGNEMLADIEFDDDLGVARLREKEEEISRT